MLAEDGWAEELFDSRAIGLARFGSASPMESTYLQKMGSKCPLAVEPAFALRRVRLSLEVVSEFQPKRSRARTTYKEKREHAPVVYDHSIIETGERGDLL